MSCRSASAPLGSGTSLPSSLQTVANLRELGHRVDIDDDALARVNDYLGRLARAEGLPFGQPRDFDARFFRHQVAGGRLTTTKRQLAELKLGHRFPTSWPRWTAYAPSSAIRSW